MKQKNHEWNIKTKEAHEVHPVNSFEFFFSHNKDVKPHTHNACEWYAESWVIGISVFYYFSEIPKL